MWEQFESSEGRGFLWKVYRRGLKDERINKRTLFFVATHKNCIKLRGKGDCVSMIFIKRMKRPQLNPRNCIQLNVLLKIQWQTRSSENQTASQLQSIGWFRVTGERVGRASDVRTNTGKGLNLNYGLIGWQILQLCWCKTKNSPIKVQCMVYWWQNKQNPNPSNCARYIISSIWRKLFPLQLSLYLVGVARKHCFNRENKRMCQIWKTASLQVFIIHADSYTQMMTRRNTVVTA